MFHYDCIEKWRDSKYGSSCPICRSTLDEMDHLLFEEQINKLIGHIKKCKEFVILHEYLKQNLKNEYLKQNLKNDSFKEIVKTMHLILSENPSTSQVKILKDMTERLDMYMRVM